MEILKSFWANITIITSTTFAFIGSYFMDLTADNFEQYLSVCSVILLDGIFGTISGIQREGFKTFKAIRVIKTLITWLILLTIILLIEASFPGTSWLSETILMPFIIFELLSALKNAAQAGFIDSKLINMIVSNIDIHKNTKELSEAEESIRSSKSFLRINNDHLSDNDNITIK